MLKNPIPKVTDQLQYRAIGIINGKFIPNDSEQLNSGYLTDSKGEKIETVVLGKALSLFIQRIKTLKTCIYKLPAFGILINLMIFKVIPQKQTFLNY